MPGYRKTHNYPHGKPAPLVLLEIAMAVLCAAWVFLVPGHAPRAIGAIFAFLLIVWGHTNLHRRYERIGQAVPIPRQKVVVAFPKGLPVPVLMLRGAFFAIVAIMVALGILPVATSTARAGIITCVFALIGVAALNLVLEHHYVNTGRTALQPENTGPTRDGRDQEAR
jgi:hypothetical protein